MNFICDLSSRISNSNAVHSWVDSFGIFYFIVYSNSMKCKFRLIFCRLLQFLPTLKVKEQARKLRKSIAKDMFQGFSPKNILSMTFRQAVLEQLWSLELALFEPGTERNMNDLENPREVH